MKMKGSEIMKKSKTSSVAKNKWNAKAYDSVLINFKKGQKSPIAEYAKKKGMSLNGYINYLIKIDMGDEYPNPDNIEMTSIEK